MMKQSAIGYRHCYCVVYLVYGIHYRFRCFCHNAREARKECHDMVGVAYRDIVEVYRED